MTNMEDVADTQELKVAIVGMAGRFPGAGCVDEYWNLLKEGRTAITEFSKSDLRSAGLSDALIDHPDLIAKYAVLSGVNEFDASFFEVAPQEARIINPQARLLLQYAYLALENSGFWYDKGATDERVGVYIGSSHNDYIARLLSSMRDSARTSQVMIGNINDFLSTLVSYKLGLTGPSINIQTACSSSLVAVHTACQSLIAGECDVALAGGVAVRCFRPKGYLWQADGVLSKSGACRPFSALADGIVNGDGVGVVVLRRLEDAVRAGESILAVIRGTAVNNDGSHKAGYTAPSVVGQVEVISDALRVAGLTADEVGFIEAHGTGTKLGDPIEFEALRQVFIDRKGGNACALGSVKANIGHLDAAAGIAGLIKAILVLRNGQIPGQPNFVAPSSHLSIHDSPFYIPRNLTHWPNSGCRKRVAGISSFGIGGTNAHVVLEEYPSTVPVHSEEGPLIFPVSAKTEASAKAFISAMERAGLESKSAATASTLSLRRPHYEWRSFGLAHWNHVAQAHDVVKFVSPKAVSTEIADGGICFLFPGQGALSWLTLDELAGSRHYASAFSQCIDMLSEISCRDVSALLKDPLYRNSGAPLAQFGLSQALHVSVQHALSTHWQALGVVPRCVMGHSLGEYSAAIVASVIDLKDALKVLVERERLCQSLRRGGMIAVTALDKQSMQAWQMRGLCISALNSIDHVTLSGPAELVDKFQHWAMAEKLIARRIGVEVAFHSKELQPIVPVFQNHLRTVKLSRPTTQFISTVTGQIEHERLTSPQYWADHLINPVRFQDAVATALMTTHTTFIELGAAAGLTSLIEKDRRWDSCKHAVVSGMRSAYKDGQASELLRQVGNLWQLGHSVSWNQVVTDLPSVNLPGYQFERSEYYVEESAPVALRDVQPDVAEITGLKQYPATEAKAQILQFLTEVLGPQDKEKSFWEQGGTSLIAIQIVAFVRTHLHREVSLLDLSSAKSTHEFAEIVAKRSPKDFDGSVHGVKIDEAIQATTIPTFAHLQLVRASLLQRRLWVLDRLRPNTALFNVSAGFKILGSLDVGTLERALLEVSARHSSLRTKFAMLGEDIMQLISPESKSNLHIIQLDHASPESSKQSQARSCISAERQRPFDLTTGPLWRVTAIRIAEHEVWLHLCMHHIISDGTSIGLFLAEVMRVYASFTSGSDKVLSEKHLQYTDFAEWQHRTFNEKALSEARTYWRRYLNSLPALVQARKDEDLACAAVGSEFLPVIVEEEDFLCLQRSCERLNISMFSAIATAVSLAIRTVFDASEVVLGCPVDMRDRVELKSVIGFFINTIPLRIDTSVGGDLPSLLTHVHQTIQSSLAHAILPYDDIVREVSSSIKVREGLYNVLLSIGAPFPRTAALKSWRIEALPAHPAMDTADIGFFVTNTRNCLSISIAFKKDFCSLAQANELLEALANMMKVSQGVLDLQRNPGVDHFNEEEFNFSFE